MPHGPTSSTKSNDTLTERIFNYLSWLAPVISSIAIILIFTIYFSKYNGELGDQAMFGAFGDFVGGLLNPIFTFLTMMLLIFSIRFQINELKLTREEMIRTRDVHDKNVSQSSNSAIIPYALDSVKKLEDEFNKFVDEEICIEFDASDNSKTKKMRFRSLSAVGQWNKSNQIDKLDHFVDYERAKWKRICLHENRVVAIYDIRRYLISGIYPLSRDLAEVYEIIYKSDAPTFLYLSSFAKTYRVLDKIVSKINRDTFLNNYNPNDLEYIKRGITLINENMARVKVIHEKLPTARLDSYRPPVV